MPKTANPSGLSYRQRALVEALPAHGWNVSRAAQAVGYTKKYSLAGLPGTLRKNRALADAVAAKKRQLAQEHAVEAAEVIAGLRKIAYDESASKADRLRAFELLGRSIALFTDRQVTDHTVYLGPPVDPDERRRWLDEQRRLLDRQQRVGTAIAGEILDGSLG